MSAPIEVAGLPRPDISLDQARVFAAELFAVEPRGVKELGSQQDRNFLLSTPDGCRHLLKVSNPAFTREEIEAQNAAMEHLADAGFNTPLPLASCSGEEVEAVTVNGRVHYVRLLTFVEGAPLIERAHLGTHLMRELGASLGRASKAFSDFQHVGLTRSLQWDLRAGENVVADLLPFVQVNWKRDMLSDVLTRVKHVLAPLKGQLPVQAVHGDMTDDNVVYVVSPEGLPRLAGVIDFGDTMYSWRVSELAVACASLFHHNPTNPLAVLPLIQAFHDVVPLSEAEIQALWPLIVLRGAVLAVSGEQQTAIDAGNDYASAALDREWIAFESPATYSWNAAEASIRASLGVPRNGGVRLSNPSPLIPRLTQATPVTVNLGWDSAAFKSGSWIKGPEEERSIIEELTSQDDVVLTRFGEPRMTRANILNPEEPANVALGVEVHNCEPLDVHSPFAATLTLGEASTRAATLEGEGHIVALAGVTVDPALMNGQTLERGQLLGQTRPGGTTVWLALQTTNPDHGNPPGFVRATELRGYCETYLDPTNLLSGIHAAPTPPTHFNGPSIELVRRRNTFDPLQAHYYEEPPRIERGWKEHLIDTNGRHYLDMVNNVTVLGHGHPAVAEAASRQWEMLNTNSRFHYGAVARFSERLLSLVPDSFDTVFLVNSGTEAVDLALRLSKAYTDRDDVLCCEESYHGWSLAADAVSTSISDNPRADETRPEWVHVLAAPNDYRGTHRGEGAGREYAKDAQDLLQHLRQTGTPVGTYISEPRNGNAGAIGTPPSYLESVYHAVRAQGGICISDEVQVGYGRLGEHFWGYEEHKVVPDIVTMAKAMGNGHPLGAVITRREIANALAAQGSFFSSGGGSTLSSQMGITVLDIIEREKLQENAKTAGRILSDGFRDLMGRHSLIGAVHGMGLYQGVEFVRNRESLEPAKEETTAICDRMRELGVMVLPTGDRQNILKIKPPLCFSADSAHYFLRILDEVLTNGW